MTATLASTPSPDVNSLINWEESEKRGDAAAAAVIDAAKASSANGSPSQQSILASDSPELNQLPLGQGSPNASVAEGANANSAAGGPSDEGNASSDSAADQKAASDALTKLEKERVEAIRKINEKHAAKAFLLQQKSVSLPTRRALAFDVLEGMRATTREHLHNPYMSDADVDKQIVEFFSAGLPKI